MRTILALLLFALPAVASAESVFVKYRGMVDLGRFACTSTESSFVKRVCYDAPNRYMLIELSGTFYHYCGIGSETVSALLDADSKGRFYNAEIKGRFDCRLGVVPSG